MADSTQPGEQEKANSEKKEKARERNKRYRERHPDVGRLYYLANRDRILQKCKKYRQENLEAKRQKNREYYSSHREKILAWNKSPAGRASQKRRRQKIAGDPAMLKEKQEKDRMYSKRYRQRHPERRKQSTKKYRESNKHKEKDARLRRIARDADGYRKVAAERSRRTRKRFSEKHGISYSAARARADKEFALMKSIRNRVDLAIKRYGVTKKDRTLVLVGCSVSELVKHIESRFVSGMSWDNRGKWHLDHVIPVSAFDLNDPCQQEAAFHYTNLQPLWARDNLSKKDKLPGQHLFGFAYADKIAAAAKPKKRQRYGREHRES